MILGTDNSELHDQIFDTGSALADSGDFDKCIDLWFYGLNLKQNYDEELIVVCFPQLFAMMFDDGIKIKFSSLLESFQKAATEVTL